MNGICYNYDGGNKMKKNNLWKAIGVCFIIFIVLSWIIPEGTFTSGIFSKGTTAPLGFMDILRYPIITASTTLFLLTAFVILLIGGFYGVLNQTGVYANIVNKVSAYFKEKENIFLIITILLFSVLASLTALTLPLFIMVPFFVAVILTLGYNKVTAMLSTVGAILVGNMASTYGFNINGYISFFFETGINDTIVTRMLFYLVTMILFIGFVLFLGSKSKGNVDKKSLKNEGQSLEIPLYKNREESKKSAVPVVLISIFMMVLVLVGMYNWETGLHVEVFNNIYKSIMEFEISGYAIFKNLIGSIDPIGYWSNYELAIILFLATLLIAWIYNVKGKDKWEAILDGIKEMVPVAIYTVAASILFLLMNATSNSTTGATFFQTIANFFITMTNGFHALTFGALSMIGGVFYNDFPYLLNSLYVPITSLYTNYGFIGMFMQMIHGLVMLIAPTSVILVAGLRFLNISYTEWFKNIWKYLLLAIVAIATFTVVLLLMG